MDFEVRRYIDRSQIKIIRDFDKACSRGGYGYKGTKVFFLKNSRFAYYTCGNGPWDISNYRWARLRFGHRLYAELSQRALLNHFFKKKDYIEELLQMNK